MSLSLKKEKKKKKRHEKVFHERMYPTAIPQMMGTSALARKQPLSADGTMEAGRRESTNWHDGGTNSRRELELDVMGLLKCTINTQLSQNLLSLQFQISSVAAFANKFKHVNVLIYLAGPRSIGAEEKRRRGWVVVRKMLWMLGNAPECESLLVVITRLHTFFQTGSQSTRKCTQSNVNITSLV